MRCNECGNTFKGSKCACGWSPPKPGAQPHPSLMCATPSCPYDARVRVGTPRVVTRTDGQRVTVRGSPWRNFCCSCADADYHKEAASWCESQGLHTTEQIRERMHEMLRDMGRRQGNPRHVGGRTREPGEDIEEAFP